jgi:hypothetical protein
MRLPPHWVSRHHPNRLFARVISARRSDRTLVLRAVAVVYRGDHGGVGQLFSYRPNICCAVDASRPSVGSSSSSRRGRAMLRPPRRRRPSPGQVPRRMRTAAARRRERREVDEQFAAQPNQPLQTDRVSAEPFAVAGRDPGKRKCSHTAAGCVHRERGGRTGDRAARNQTARQRE